MFKEYEEIINKTFSRTYSPVRGRRLIKLFNTVNVKVNEYRIHSNDKMLVHRSFLLAIEDFINKFGALEDLHYMQYNYSRLSFLFKRFLNCLDTLYRLNMFIEPDRIGQMFKDIITVFSTRGWKIEDHVKEQRI